MVVLSVAITSKSGKVLLARQFIPMSRIRIEGLLSAFPKLMDAGKQHTFVETENVRYVYQPLESLFLLLITNKSSNIVEDLDTLRIVARLVPEYCKSLTEDEVQNKAFEIIFALDEVISLGYRENLSLDQIKTFLGMESHEENLAKLIQASQMESAKQEMRRKAKQIAQDKALNPGKATAGGISSADPYYGGRGSSDSPSPVGTGNNFSRTSSTGSLGSNSKSSSSSNLVSASSRGSAPSAPAPAIQDLRAGLGAGSKARKGGDLLQQLIDEEGLNPDDMSSGSLGAPGASASPAIAPASSFTAATESIHIKTSEVISAEVTRDGDIKRLEVKGDMHLTISDPAASMVKIHLARDRKPGFNTMPHPNINKQLFNDDSVLAIKMAGKGFPAGNAVEVLRWRLTKPDDSSLPLTITCWPAVSSDGISVNVEYSMQRSDVPLQNVQIRIPIPSPDINITSLEIGSYKLDGRTRELVWIIPSIDATADPSSTNGTLEFSVANAGGADSNAFFPISVAFASTRANLSNVQVRDVISTVNGASVKFSQEALLSADQYLIL